MAHLDIYNTEGKTNGTIEVNDAIFAVPVKSAVVHQVYTAQMANARESWAHTKNRGEVRGGGKKPWRQKGTGRARHGSIRSPLWRGGGITFGPLKERVYTQKVNIKMNRQAVRMCLSDKLTDKKLIVIDALVNDGKTRSVAALRRLLPGAGKSTLILSTPENEKVHVATRNVPHVDVQRAIDVSVLDLLHHQYVITTKEGIAILEKRLAR